MAPRTPRTKQSILKRDADGNVIYDESGRPVVERRVTASRKRFKSTKPSSSGKCISRVMTDDERERYGEPCKKLDAAERKRVGERALLLTADERRRYLYRN